MSDKMKPGVSVRTTFVDGESPKAAKLNSLSAQLLNASKRLEAAIGDHIDESYPYSSINSARLSLEYGRNVDASGALSGAPMRSLDIVNISRIIGPASNLNPHQIGSNTVTEEIPSGVHETCLQYIPDLTTPAVFSDTTVFSNLCSSASQLLSEGDYFINGAGQIYTILPMDGGTVEYVADANLANGGDSYQDSSFNVIPDLNQLEAGSGCIIGTMDVNGRRIITLPTCTHHHYSIEENSITLTDADQLNGQQLKLPKVLSDYYASEEALPEGFLYLKNYTKDIVYTTASYYYYDETAIVIGNKDITDDVEAGDIFGIITVGTDITTSIDSLRKKTSRHSHDRRHGEMLVDATALGKVLSAAGNSGVFVPSEIPGNIMPQYLHRDGYTLGIDANANDSNCMRGDLAIGANVSTPGEYDSVNNTESFKLKFLGQGGDASNIYSDADGNLIIAAAKDFIDLETEIRLTVGVNNKDIDYNIGILTTGGGYIVSQSIKPFSIKVLNADPVLGVLIGCDLRDFGFSTEKRILSINLMVKRSEDSTWMLPSDSSDYGYYAVVSDENIASGDPYSIAMTLTGTEWFTGTLKYDWKAVIWYY